MCVQFDWPNWWKLSYWYWLSDGLKGNLEVDGFTCCRMALSLAPCGGTGVQYSCCCYIGIPLSEMPIRALVILLSHVRAVWGSGVRHVETHGKVINRRTNVVICIRISSKRFGTLGRWMGVIKEFFHCFFTIVSSRPGFSIWLAFVLLCESRELMQKPVLCCLLCWLMTCRKKEKKCVVITCGV